MLRTKEGASLGICVDSINQDSFLQCKQTLRQALTLGNMCAAESVSDGHSGDARAR